MTEPMFRTQIWCLVSDFMLHMNVCNVLTYVTHEYKMCSVRTYGTYEKCYFRTYVTHENLMSEPTVGYPRKYDVFVRAYVTYETM